MPGLRRTLARTPVVGRTLLAMVRARIAWSYYRQPLGGIVRWLFHSRELANFTYDLTPLNVRYLAALLGDLTGEDADTVASYLAELQNDVSLRRHVAEATAKSDQSHVADREVRFGRRLGWYALARILKPRLVVETGVDKGIGACVLTSALMRNAAEGHPGRYLGTDIDPKAGYLLAGDYAVHGRVLYGDSIESLRRIEEPIDLFINDSDHSADYEAREYRTIAGKLSEGAFVLGDNSHVTDALLEFSRAANRHFVFFQEKPLDHWYPGAGIGISFRRRA